MNPRIELHIEELVLHGFRPADRQRIASSIEGELTRLIRERGVDSFQAAEHATIDAGVIRMEAAPSAAQVGRQVASSVFGAITR